MRAKRRWALWALGLNGVVRCEVWLTTHKESKEDYGKRIETEVKGATKSLAIVIRGLLYLEHREPMSSGRKVVKDFLHDATQRAMPSLSRLAAKAREDCGYYTETIAVSTVKNFPDQYLETIVDSHVSAVVMFDSQHGTEKQTASQFGLASYALKTLADVLRPFNMILLTRDDFVYSDWAWNVLSTRFDPRPETLNLVNTDCSRHAWDGLHIFRGDDVDRYASEFQPMGKWAHHLDIHGYSTNYFFFGKYSQPDRCHPAMGFIDRTSDPSDTSDGHHNWTLPNECCANFTQEILDMTPVFRQCPVLDQPPVVYEFGASSSSASVESSSETSEDQEPVVPDDNNNNNNNNPEDSKMLKMELEFIRKEIKSDRKVLAEIESKVEAAASSTREQFYIDARRDSAADLAKLRDQETILLRSIFGASSSSSEEVEEDEVPPADGSV